MVRQVVQSQCGVQFNHDALQRANISESTFMGPGFPVASVNSTTPTKGGKIQPTLHYFTETKEEKEGSDGGRRSEESDETDASHASTLLDATQSIHDQLKKKPWWWRLEVIPTFYTYQDGQGVWHNKWGSVLELTMVWI